MHNGQYPLADGGTAKFVVGMKGCLSTAMAMNSANSGWNTCTMRTWLNGDFKTQMPAELLPIFKPMKIITADGKGSTTAISMDTFALFAEKEIFGTNDEANSTAEASLFQIEWYKTPSNRIKGVKFPAPYYWERSPSTDYGYCCVYDATGAPSNYNSTGSLGVSPFGCI